MILAALLLGAATVASTQAPDATTMNTAKVRFLFERFHDLVDAEDRKDQAALQRAFGDLRIFPAYLAEIRAGARHLVHEEGLVTRKAMAALCSRRNELFTPALYDSGYRQAMADIQAWRVRALSEFQNSIPNQKTFTDVLAAMDTLMREDRIPIRMLEEVELVVRSAEERFQAWRDSDCSTTADAGERPEDIAQSLLKDKSVFNLLVTIRPTNETQDLRGVSLIAILNESTVVTIESAAMWANGTPISASAFISVDQARALIKVLEDSGFFSMAGKYYTQGNSTDPGSHPQPEGAVDYRVAFPGTRPPEPGKPGFDLDLRANDKYWTTYYKATFGTSSSDLRLLGALRQVLDEQPAGLISRLEQQLD